MDHLAHMRTSPTYLYEWLLSLLKDKASSFFIFWQAGKLEIYDISAGQLLESVDAHEGPVWSVSLASDKVRTFCARYYM